MGEHQFHIVVSAVSLIKLLRLTFNFLPSSGLNSGSASPPSKQNGTSGSSQADDVEEPFDFKADDFVSAIDKLLHGKIPYAN